jgi:salicylate hydroxylase
VLFTDDSSNWANGSSHSVIHRADYHRILFDEAKLLGADIRFGATVEDIFFDGPEVLLTGGERISGDVVIGADGLDPVSPQREVSNMASNQLENRSMV